MPLLNLKNPKIKQVIITSIFALALCVLSLGCGEFQVNSIENLNSTSQSSTLPEALNSSSQQEPKVPNGSEESSNSNSSTSTPSQPSTSPSENSQSSTSSSTSNTSENPSQVSPPSESNSKLVLKSSEPIDLKEDNFTIENLEINSPSHSKCGIKLSNRKNITIKNISIRHAGAGICIFNSENITIEAVKLVNTISVAGPHCRPGLTVQECKNTHRTKHPEKLYPVNTHNNIWIQNSKKVKISRAYLEKGESGIFAYKTSALEMRHIHCSDIRGPYWRGQCVQVQASHGAIISNFYIQQFFETSSGHDNINAYESSDVIVQNGLIDGNYSRNGVGVIADKDAHNMTVRNVDVIHNGVAAVNVWSGPTNQDNGGIGTNFTVENIRVKNGHCDKTWYNKENYGPSSGGLAFAMHPLAKGAQYLNSVYWNHCRNEAVYGVKDRRGITKSNFEVKAPPVELNFPW